MYWQTYLPRQKITPYFQTRSQRCAKDTNEGEGERSRDALYSLLDIERKRLPCVITLVHLYESRRTEVASPRIGTVSIATKIENAVLSNRVGQTASDLSFKRYKNPVFYGNP